MKHKHADLIKAWAGGAKIQAISDDGSKWNDCNSAPNWNPFRTYRIKPEPKPDVLAYCSVGETLGTITSVYVSNAYFEASYSSNLKLTFCGETGKLKSAEVLK